MKREKAKEGTGDVRAYVDMSALYRSDENRPRHRKRGKRAAPKDCAGSNGEKQAVREAISGWRWL